MRATRRSTLVLLAGLSFSATPGCGDAGPQVVRVVVYGVCEGEPLEPGEVDVLEAEGQIYGALMRFGSVTVTSDADTVASASPANADLFGQAIVFEEEVSGTRLTELVLELPAPEGAGVLPGEPVSIFAAGLIEDRRVEYRDRDMDPFVVALDAPLSNGGALLKVFFEVHDWFTEVDADALAPLPGPPFRLDADRAPALAASIEARIRASLGHTAEAAEDDPDSEAAGDL